MGWSYGNCEIPRRIGGPMFNLQDNDGKTFFDYLKPEYKEEIEGFLERLSWRLYQR